MGGEILYRDPRSPRDVYGPCTIDQIRELAKRGRLQPTDQVSLDGRAWLPATQLEPELFSTSTADWRVSRLPWQRAPIAASRLIKLFGTTMWRYLRVVMAFYWTQRKELRQLATEYLTFLQQPGNRRELRVAAHDQNPAVYFDKGQWHADLPDCCVVCGNAADCDWNSERRSVPDLTWPLLGPVIGALFGLLGWIILWTSSGRWLVPLGIFAGFLVGYWQCSETIVTVRFRRCRDHLTRTRYPALRTFHNTLIIGIGDRKVWRRFYYGDRDIETPYVIPSGPPTAIESNRPGSDTDDVRPTYPTIPLVGDSETNADERSTEPSR